MIPIAKAHFWWSDRGELEVVEFGGSRQAAWLRRDDRSASAGRLIFDTGACESDWREATDAQRYQLMLEMIPDFVMTNGIPIDVVIREMSKVDVFRAEAKCSLPLARAVNKAEGRGSSEDLRLGGR